MANINTMVKRIATLVDTNDINDWEQEFITNILEVTAGGKVVAQLSDNRIKSVERIFKKHFGD